MKYGGGAAFPINLHRDINQEVILWPESGMNLRDYFATAALACPMLIRAEIRTNAQLAQSLYAFADAMLAEREK